MTFQIQIKEIERLLEQDTYKCLAYLTSKSTISSLFYPELRQLNTFFETHLLCKQAPSHNHQSNKITKVQTILAFYSIIIIRSSLVAVKNSQESESIYNSKLATETLTKIYRSLEEGDPLKSIAGSLLLRIKNFNNYKMIVKSMSPKYVTNETMDHHYQQIKTQCPNLLEQQLLTFKASNWSKFLQYKEITLQEYHLLIDQLLLKQSQNQDQVALSQMVEKIVNEKQYLVNRLQLIEETQQVESINLEDITIRFEAIYQAIINRIKQITKISLTFRSQKNQLNVDVAQYSLNEVKYNCYLTIFNSMVELLIEFVVYLGGGWVRKIKWLFSFIETVFVNHSIKGNFSHQSSAIQSANILLNIVKLVSTYFVVFGSGYFPLNKLTNFLFIEEYSIYKLIEAILYNEYNYSEGDSASIQNYQKSKNNDRKGKQAIIDLVNINMKSLNLNPHYDSILSKFVPRLKNGIKLMSKIVHQALFMMVKYYEKADTFTSAAQLLLMLKNAKNVRFVVQRQNKWLAQRIERIVYPANSYVRQGIQYFCEEYFADYISQNKIKLDALLAQIQTPSIPHQNQNDQGNAHPIKKTESKDIMEGWQSIREEEIIESDPKARQSLKANNNSDPAEGQYVNSEIFYSIKDSTKKGGQLQREKSVHEDENIVLPSFE